jgi:Lipid A core - O-antigen ligase and related enzymes
MAPSLEPRFSTKLPGTGPYDHLHSVCSGGVGLFFGLMFALRSGYSYGASVLLLLSLWVLFAPSCKNYRHAGVWSREETALAMTLLGYFVVAALSSVWLGNDLNDLDQPLRAALAVPVLWMLVRIPFDLRALWGGAVVGVVLSVGVGWWQLQVLGYDRAEGYLNIIHFGNIALVFGACCAAGLQWAASFPPKKRWMWRGILALGIVSSGYSIVASGSRGSWVALPVLVLLYGLAFLSRRNIRYAGAGIGAVLVSAAVLFQVPDSPLRERYDAALKDIELFQQGHADTSLGARFVMWHGAVLNIPERWVQGWNQDAYDKRIQERVDSGELDPVALKFTDNLHNSYLQALAFQGAAGLIALLAMYLVPLALFCRRLRDADMTVRALAYCGAALCSSYVFFSLTQVILRRNNGIMFYVLALAIVWGGMRIYERCVKRDRP